MSTVRSFAALMSVLALGYALVSEVHSVSKGETRKPSVVRTGDFSVAVNFPDKVTMKPSSKQSKKPVSAALVLNNKSNKTTNG